MPSRYNESGLWAQSTVALVHTDVMFYGSTPVPSALSSLPLLLGQLTNERVPTQTTAVRICITSSPSPIHSRCHRVYFSGYLYIQATKVKRKARGDYLSTRLNSLTHCRGFLP